LKRLGKLLRGAGGVLHVRQTHVKDRAQDDCPFAVLHFDNRSHGRNFFCVASGTNWNFFLPIFGFGEFEKGIRYGFEGSLDGQQRPLGFAGVDELQEIGSDVAFFGLRWRFGGKIKLRLSLSATGDQQVAQ